MKLTIELELKSDADPTAVEQFLAWARRIDGGPVVAEAIQVGDTRREYRDPAETPPAAGAPAEDADGGEAEEGDASTEQQAPGAAPKKRGRRTKAEMEAARAAEAAAAAATAKPAATALPPGVPPGGFAAPPPGVAAPAIPAPEVAMPPPVTALPPAATPAPEVAMPSAATASPSPAATPAPGGDALSLEDFKTMINDIHKAASSAGKTEAYPFNVMRAQTWPGGAVKGWSTMMADRVSPDQRQSVIDACLWALNN